MAYAAAIGAIVAAGAQIYSGFERSAQMRREAALRDQEADEIIRRGNINADVTRLEFRNMSGKIVSSYAKGISGGTSLFHVLNDVQSRYDQEISNITSEAEFRARQIKAGAASDRSAANATRNVSLIGGLGGLFAAGAQYTSATKGFDTKDFDYNPLASKGHLPAFEEY